MKIYDLVGNIIRRSFGCTVLTSLVVKDDLVTVEFSHASRTDFHDTTMYRKTAIFKISKRVTFFKREKIELSLVSVY